MSFWQRFDPPSCFPDDCMCEGVRDAWIRQPSAFWSSLAYLMAAFSIYRYIRPKSFELKMWAGVCALLGFSSHFGHMSFTKIALALDFASIVLTLSFFALLNLFLLLKQSALRMLTYFLLYYIVLFFVMYSMDKWTKIGVCLLIFLFAIGDVIREMGLSFLKARTLQLSLVILAVSFGLFLIDEFHVMCNPESLFQFHSLWHIGTAASIFFYGKWRFDGSIKET